MDLGKWLKWIVLAVAGVGVLGLSAAAAVVLVFVGLRIYVTV